MRTRILPAPAKLPRKVSPRHRPKIPEVLPPPSVTPEQLIQEARVLEQAISTLLSAGYGTRTVVKLVMDEYPGKYSREVVWQGVTRITDELDQMYEEEARRERPRQIARLRNDLARMRASQRVPYHNVARHEEILGRIMGTFAPTIVKADVLLTMKQSIASVIVDLTPETTDQLVAEQLELEARAQRNRDAAE